MKWSMECEVWSVQCEVWIGECDVWHEVWRVKCAAESVKWEGVEFEALKF